MANRIKQLREELRMTQIRLSIELEVAQETISAYENQKHYPSFIQLAKMSKLFNASIDYIMGLSDVRNPVSISDNITEEKLLALSKQLSTEQVQLVLAYMQGILDATK